MRKNTKQIKVGNVLIGGGAPISIQTMTNTKTQDTTATINQILNCEKLGCDLIRIAINSKEDAHALKIIKRSINIPVIADIQYDYKLALWAHENGADCIRINPGNMNRKSDLVELVSNLNSTNTPIRIGVNSGSINLKLIDKYGGVTPDCMVESAINECNLLEDLNFTNFKVAIKSSDVYHTIECYTKFSKLKNYPLHIGITEAGPYSSGIVKSSIGLGILLYNGIGDTLRVSLTDKPETEVVAGINILKSLNLNSKGINIISCPTCSRTNGEMIELVKQFENNLPKINKKLNVAIMGCPVNGPGEAREADIGIALGKNSVTLFKKGKIIRKISVSKAIEELNKEILSIEMESEDE